MDETQIDDPYPKLGRKQFIFISKRVTMQRMRRDKKALKAPEKPPIIGSWALLMRLESGPAKVSPNSI